MTGCGESAIPGALQGQFIDSPVANIDYSGTQNSAGRTDANGTFSYGRGEIVSFRLGQIEFGQSAGQRFILLTDLGSARAARNKARFLLTLDADQDPANNIQISETVRQAAQSRVFAASEFDLTDAAFDASELARFATSANNDNRNLVDADEAQRHMDCSEEDVNSDGQFDHSSCDEPAPPPPGNDADADGIDDDADNCPSDPNADQADFDADGAGDVCDSDDDEDGVNDSSDNCPFVANSDQANQDGDTSGDLCDDDVDGDQIDNADDNCPSDTNPGQEDQDADGIGDACDDPPDTGDRESAFPDCYDAALITANTTEQHACTWSAFAHGLQRQLDATTPMVEALWLASHNSYNYPDPTNQSSSDPNQLVDITEQLTLEMRGVEIDIHWAESPRCSGDLQPLVCHSQGDHSTCSGTEPTADVHFATIRDWLLDHPGEIVQVDIESNFSVNRTPPCPPGAPEPTGGDPFEVVRDQLLDVFGDMIYLPQGGDCQQLPLALTRQEILDSGAQVLVTGSCNAGWQTVVHGLDVRKQKVHDGLEGDCDATDSSSAADSFTDEDYRQRWTRMWEDSTNVGRAFVSQAQPVDAAVLGEMIRCGMNMPSIDKFTSSDARIPGSVWSWAESEPAVNDVANCALHNEDGRLVSADCAASHAWACQSSQDQSWALVEGSGTHADGSAACATLGDGRIFSVPTTGFFNDELQQVKQAAGVSQLWVNYSEDLQVEGRWLPRGQD